MIIRVGDHVTVDGVPGVIEAPHWGLRGVWIAHLETNRWRPVFEDDDAELRYLEYQMEGVRGRQDDY